MNRDHLIAKIKEAFGGNPIVYSNPDGREYPTAIYQAKIDGDGRVIAGDYSHLVTCHSYKELEAFYWTVCGINEKGKTVWLYDR